jgi:nucleotide-binding universal stress UspA family protein
MFKYILLPTDGSKLSERAVRLGIRLLDAIARQARSRRVRCATLSVTSDLAYQEIIAAARRKKCDLIMMASHGRRGLSSLLLGSDTAKVLLHSKVPVLVVR